MKGIMRSLAGGVLNDMLLRTVTRPVLGTEIGGKYHFVCAHADDEVAILNQVKKAIQNTETSFTLLTNGTQGYEAQEHLPLTLKTFGQERTREFNESLSRVGYQGSSVDSLLDERSLYNDILALDHDALKEKFDFAITSITDSIANADGVFVNDYAGGHMIHDIANFLTCEAAKKTKTPVYEYWQAFLRIPKDFTSEQVSQALSEYYNTGKLNTGIIQVAGLPGDDSHGRKIRDNNESKYTVNIPQLGIKKGRAFNGIRSILFALNHVKDVYQTQGKSMDRLKSITLASHGIDAPRFREIDLDVIDHTRLPQQGILYDHASWRVRGLPRLPNSDDYLKVISHYLENK